MGIGSHSGFDSVDPHVDPGDRGADLDGALRATLRLAPERSESVPDQLGGLCRGAARTSAVALRSHRPDLEGQKGQTDLPSSVRAARVQAEHIIGAGLAPAFYLAGLVILAALLRGHSPRLGR